jgi:translin
VNEDFDSRWDTVLTPLRDQMDGRHKAREGALQKCRLLIQTSSKCIRNIHRRQFEEAVVFLNEAKALSAAARRELAPFPTVLYASYLMDAEKEMVEAAAVFAIVRNEPLPSAADLGVDLVSFLNGMGEAASECRRYVLDEMRSGSFVEASRMLSQMESVYDELITFDYPDSLTGGLRRTCDALRAVIERTRSDLTLTQVQRELLDELRKVHG